MAYNNKPFTKKTWLKTNKSEVKAYKPKRGALKPLLTEETKQTANTQDLSYDFSCRIIRLYQYLTEDADYKEYIMSKQVYRSGTSIGANVREAQHSQSDADFLSKMSIAFKEADETNYWLSLLHDNGYLTDSQFSSLNNDNQRILRLLTTITKSVKIKLDKAKQK